MEMMIIGIFYFSGTGNTKYITELLAKNLKNENTLVEIDKIEDIVQLELHSLLEKMDLVGFGYPVHAFNAPKNVLNFISNVLPNIPNKKSFTYRTAGDPFMKSGSTSMVRKKLEKKGF